MKLASDCELKRCECTQGSVPQEQASAAALYTLVSHQVVCRSGLLLFNHHCCSLGKTYNYNNIPLPHTVLGTNAVYSYTPLQSGVTINNNYLLSKNVQNIFKITSNNMDTIASNKCKDFSLHVPQGNYS